MQIIFKTLGKGGLPSSLESAALPVGRQGVLGDFGQQLDERCDGAISHIIATTGFSGASATQLDIPAPHGLGLAHLVLFGIGDADAFDVTAQENLGGHMIRKLCALPAATQKPGRAVALLADNPDGYDLDKDHFAAALASGARLGHYRFDNYKTKHRRENDSHDDNAAADSTPGFCTELTLVTAKPKQSETLFAPRNAVCDGVYLARDLILEPPNKLYPESFVAHVKKALSGHKLEIRVLDEDAMGKLNMGALLGVGQGSARPSRLLVIEWKGTAAKHQPCVFVGKGVTFDTGGISLKPGAGMGDMKADMAGGACVAGLMLALASRRAAVNAVGLVGLVENMPDAKAQRPGDIVATMSGQTVEILNTDAEGRLVLADVLTYAQDQFKPQFIVDLATLTGAIIIALGKQYAGLFSNDDDLCTALSAAAAKVDEKLWRMPLNKAFDKMINSKYADMQNISNGRDASSITAAQFLQRFVGDVAWAHLDIAGVAIDSPKTGINPVWSCGYGVRLLDCLIADHYETGT